jgi:hypothetical protein
MRGFNEKLFGDKLVAGQLPTQLGLIGSQEVNDFLGLLDTYPNAAGAYALRGLRIAYTGNLIRVRRSSDNAEQDIGFINNVNRNLDTTTLTSFCSGTNGFVTTWYDQSGNGRNATQTTAANQPQIVSSGAVITDNTKSAIQFTGADTNYMVFSSINTNPFTILWVSKKSNQLGNTSIILSGSRNGLYYMGDDVAGEGNPTGYTGTAIIRTSLNNTSASGAENTQHLAYLNRRNSTQAVGQFNNSNNSYNNSISNSNAIIDSIAYYTSGFNFAGLLQEIIIYTTDESANRTGISSNINTYYGIY